MTEFLDRSLSEKIRKISAPAALKVLCPDLYSGNGGVGNHVGLMAIYLFERPLPKARLDRGLSAYAVKA